MTETDKRETLKAEITRLRLLGMEEEAEDLQDRLILMGGESSGYRQQVLPVPGAKIHDTH